MMHILHGVRRAIRRTRALDRQHPEAAEAVRSGDRARDEGDWREACAHYRAALAADPMRTPIWIQYGHALKESGATHEALAAYRSALRQSPNCPDAHLHLAHALKLLDRIGEAETAYLESLRLDPRQTPARIELASLGWDREALDGVTPGPDATGSDARVASAPRHQVAIDVSDLLQHFGRSRTMTGIQRVQLSVVEGIVTADPAIDVRIVCFSPATGAWIDVPVALVLRAGALARRSGDAARPDWQALVAECSNCLSHGATAHFAEGAFLLNLGTSWWLRNYFLAVRALKVRCGVRYVPFVHDLIPLVTPEHCTPALRRDFLDWLAGVFDHADLYLVNSNATRRALLAVAASLGRTITVADPIRLDGFASAARRCTPPPEAPAPFVLFVSTIESRKNHLLAFDAWLHLIRERGEANVPDLVCVGSRGWMVEAAMSRLSSSDALRRKVRLVEAASDAELAALYERCLFTLYPSAHEGWGLPVTESLAHGKVALVADATSLPEAGGSFAVYFDPRSARDFDTKLARLIDDGAYRSDLEGRIRAGFRARAWSDVAQDIVERLTQFDAAEPGTPSSASVAFRAEPGVFYELGASDHPVWPPNPANGERFRGGTGWGTPEPSGCRAGSGAVLAWRVPREAADADFQICLAFDEEDHGERTPGLGRPLTLRRLRVRPDAEGVLRIAVSASMPSLNVSPQASTPPPVLVVAGFTFFRCDDERRAREFVERALFGELTGSTAPCAIGSELQEIA